MSNRYDLIGYCSYRDNETGKISDNFVGVLNEQDQKIKELEHRLANCIEPKFKKGDKAYALISGVFDTYVKPVDIIGIMLGYKVFDGDYISNQNYTKIFATEEEARAKLEELKK